MKSAQMINKIAILLISLLSVKFSGACTVPFNGPEYDALIDVTRIGENNTFRVEVPTKWNNAKIQSIHIAYTKLPLSGLRIAEFMIDLKSTLSLSEKVISGEFSPELKIGFAPYLHVT